ncbi:Na+/H+ antiporter subunit E [Pseudoclavibacter chungangensis]|uniref:Na+/H+ antiporter subunit E n=1 Tax=Pseudoclavibacter chungangensis TaxID=587635 RepID=A0A7J5BYV1_9MICO|nr:Na+/H+ antiporter subunit E [Pseudoclavibacter chungangensis]KAB1659529.1 Na+/H+ antiporter subunit E [Pseudoclavibacter chungangensis]NYJ67608.1 multicomponent Na+:H+ antiporter subunit E [Pseudoclavibacter chungangensis]
MKHHDRAERRTLRHNFRVQSPLLVALVLFWLVLWGHVDVISVVTGIVFSIAVVRVFYLPAVALSGRFNLWWFIVFLAVFMWRLTIASFQVAWLAVRPKPVPRSSVVAVPLRTRSDFILTLTAEVNILVPGSVVVEADRIGSVLYLHVIGADTDEKVAKAVEDALDIEERLALALGTRDDIWRINRDRREHGEAPVGLWRKQHAHEELRDEQLAERKRELAAAGDLVTDDEVERDLVDEAHAERNAGVDTEGAEEEERT